MSLKDRTESIWGGVGLPQFERLKTKHKTGICVVGGGISGLSIAYQMAKRGHKVTVVEAFRLGSGQTGRTTAHLTCQLEEQFTELLKMHDLETVRTFFEAHRKAIDVMEEIVTNENISCDFKRLDGYLFQGKNFSREKLIQEQRAAKEVGVHLELVEAPLLNEPRMALRYKDQAQFHPMKYLAGLVRLLQDLGVTIFEGTHVHEFDQESTDLWVLETDLKQYIEAKHVVVATNTPVNNRFYIHNKQSAYRTYAMGFKIEHPPGENCLLWDTEDPYHYVRFQDDILIVGGEDHRTGHEPDLPFEKLEAWSRAHFNFLGGVEWKWSGQVFEPVDQIGFIGRNPGHEKNIYVSTGESGIGLTSATIASLIIPDLVDRGDHPWAKTFDPARPPVKGFKDFIQDNAHLAFQYTDWVKPSEVKDFTSIPVDCGAVIRDGLSKSCVYHDQNSFDKKSAVCPHLGGIVHWNDVEKTWDCPVHGSRFNSKGKVIEGPAVSDLPEK